MNKVSCLYTLLVFTLFLAGCDINLQQPTSVPAGSTLDADPSAPTTSQVPMSWGHLGLTGKLIYLSSARENDLVAGTIQSLDLTTGELTTILSVPRGWIHYATISPDAQLLVMSYTAPPEQGATPNRILYQMPVDGSQPPQPLFTPPTPNDRYTQVEWSPDGQYLYFVHYDINKRMVGQLDPVYDIQRIRYPDGQPELVTGYAFWPRISPEADRIVYIRIEPETAANGLVIANADGSNPQEVQLSTAVPVEIIDAPIFSPDGQLLLFSVPTEPTLSQLPWYDRLMGVQIAQAHDVPSDWWSVPVTGGEPTQLTRLQTINLFASFSPDKTRIASVSGEGLFVMRLDGSELTQLVRDPNVHGTVSWIP